MRPRSKGHAALGTAIRELRGERGISQEALALEANLDRAYAGKVERGESNVALDNLVRVADALGVPASTLLARAERHGLGVKALPPKRRTARSRR